MTDGMVLVHGGLHTGACWKLIVPLIDVPVRAVDLPGRGSRPAPLDTVTLGDCVDAVLEEAERAGFARFALVAHSLGGVTATETAYRHPDRVTHLVLVGALVPPPGSNASIVMFGEPLDAMTDMTEERARALFGNDMTDDQWAEHYGGLVPEAVALMNAALSGYPRGIPTLYVDMSADVPVPPELAARMAANLGPHVERRTIDAGHTVMVTQPEQLADLVNEFVSRQPAGSSSTTVDDPTSGQPGGTARPR
ncbi:MAG: alpha/beta hydrolase [Actinomycetota bacterium]|nr:alpha/beta hydrolase [Actinomycetota bacterium]